MAAAPCDVVGVRVLPMWTRLGSEGARELSRVRVAEHADDHRLGAQATEAQKGAREVLAWERGQERASPRIAPAPVLIRARSVNRVATRSMGRPRRPTIERPDG
jgi:hypothetical protein